MAGWRDVRSIALALPEASERNDSPRRQWRVREKLFVWERPLRAREVRELGDAAPPDGRLVDAYTAELETPR